MENTIVVKGKNSYFLGARAYVLDEDREMADASWASQYIKPNKAFKWILGRYVEADNANRNRQYWTAGDLQLKHPTVKYAPLNMLHQQNHIVGAYVASEMLYPTDEAAEGNDFAHVEALAAFWKYYFPGELAMVEKAHAEGSLFYSMECVGETVTFRDGMNEETFPYRGPQDESYGAWNENANAIKQLDNPHFLGGALILPPASPGWANANIKELSAYVEKHQAETEMVYNGVKEQANHLTPEQIEAITLDLISKGMDLDDMENSNSSASMPKNVPEVNNTTTDSNEGGKHMADKTYSEDEFKAAVAEAIAPLQAALAEAQAKDTEAAHAAAIEALKAEYDAKLEELQKSLDTAVLEGESHKNELAELTALLVAAAEAAEKAAEVAARRDERLAKVKEFASFPEEYVTANADRWAELSEDVFEALLEDYKAVSKVAGEGSGEEGATDEALASTAMKAGQESKITDAVADRRAVMSLNLNGIDPRTI